MSIMIMSRLFKMSLGGCNRKLLAVRLADFADDDGRGIYPSVARLAGETELSERTVQRILADFVKEGILVVVKEATGRPGVANAYDYDLDRLFSCKTGETGDSVSPVEDGRGVTIEHERGDKWNGDGCHGDTRTVIEPLIEPLTERECVRATSDEDPKKIERKFKAWYPTWPSYLQSSEDAARKAFIALTAEERAECIAKTPAFVAAVKSTRQPRFTYAAVYLSERAWQRMEDPKDEIGPPTMHNPFSKAWSALRFFELLPDPVEPPVAPPAFLLSQLRQGGEAAAMVKRERRLAYGWPKVATLHHRAEMAEGMTVPPWLAKLSESFVGVHRDSLEAAAWRRFHERQGWPWLPVPAGVKMLFVPAGEPEQAIAAFREAVAREAGDDDEA